MSNLEQIWREKASHQQISHAVVAAMKSLANHFFFYFVLCFPPD